jgi:glycerol-3-phosphate acyltransferase PlsY
MEATLIALAAYLVGSTPFALLLGKLKGIDPREKGSKNIGATNIGRLLGRPYGIACFFLDAGKGALPVLAASLITDHDPLSMALAGAASIAGHIWPVYLRFRGGKGVATTIGVASIISPPSTAIALGSWLIGSYLLRYVFVGSVLFAVTLPIAHMAIHRQQAFSDTWPITALLLLIPPLVAIRHRTNIQRFLKGEEDRTGQPMEGRT